MPYQIDKTTQVGQYTIIADNVKIGKNCQIGHHVVIYPDTFIGNNVRIDDHAVIGKSPMIAANTDLTFKQNLKPSHIASNVIIGTHAVIYRSAQISEKVLIADLATVREKVQIGAYTIIGRGVAIEPHCEIGAYCKFETNSYLTAYSKVADHCFIAPCVATSNDPDLARAPLNHAPYKGITIEEGGRIGVGATILPGRVIEKDAAVAAGAVLTHTATRGQIFAGVPAKFLREVPKNQSLGQFLKQTKKS